MQQAAELYRQTVDTALPPPRPALPPRAASKSAKSHVLRRDRVAAQVEDEETVGPARPWSAQEPRWRADRLFSTKQRNWEGLARGRWPELRFCRYDLTVFV